MTDKNHNRISFAVSGMHCASCEILLEQKLSAVAGVSRVKASLAKSEIVVDCIDQPPSLDRLQQVVAGYGYKLESGNSQASSINWWQISGITVVVLAVYLALTRFNLLPSNLGLSQNTSLVVVFLLGLIASVSTCMAVTGGLVLTVSAKYAQQHDNWSTSKKIKPILYFSVGRLLGYAVFGGMVGLLGSVISLSPWLNGLVTIIASLTMLILGLQLLNVWPALSRLQVKPPKFLSHRIHSMGDNSSSVTPFILGALTFFLPCGFTQALQLYVLAKGDFVFGALAMGIFALGTLPALISIGVVANLVKGKVRQYLISTAAIVAIMLGLVNLKNGFALINFSRLIPKTNSVLSTATNPDSKLINGRQVIKMKVSGTTYLPARFTVRRGVPVDWIIDGTNAAGCMGSLIAPGLGIREYLPRAGATTISFTPQQVGTYKFSCPMGMGTPGASIVVVDSVSDKNNDPALNNTTNCDPTVSNCLLN